MAGGKQPAAYSSPDVHTRVYCSRLRKGRSEDWVRCRRLRIYKHLRLRMHVCVLAVVGGKVGDGGIPGGVKLHPHEGIGLILTACCGSLVLAGWEGLASLAGMARSDTAMPRCHRLPVVAACCGRNPGTRPHPVQRRGANEQSRHTDASTHT